MRTALTLLALSFLLSLVKADAFAITEIRRAYTVMDAVVHFGISDEKGRSPAFKELVVFPAHGTVSLTPSNDTIAYTPHEGYEGYDVFACTVGDNSTVHKELLCCVAVANSNVCVAALEDRACVSQGEDVVIDVLENDFSNYLIDN